MRRILKSSLTNNEFFFFKLYCDHRDLHSFPTRRSSDLQPGFSLLCFPEVNVPDSSSKGWQILVDRKSTRLNSSHSQISYAVFCLRKNQKIHIQFNNTCMLQAA